jgi:alanyl-tRNA synthetase
VARTGDIGLFVALSDSASSAGVRRIEALTGAAALRHLAARAADLAEIAGMLKSPVPEVVARVKALADERRQLANEVAQLKREVAMGGGKVEAEARRSMACLSYLR